jgi:Fe-S cluster assembly protein SufD
MSDKIEQYMIPEAAAELSLGPDWLLKKRRVSRDDFNNAPLPPRGLHLWRYTDPAKFVGNANEAGEPVTNGAQSLEHPGGLVVDRAGKDIGFSGLEAALKQGVIVAPLSQAVQDHHDLVAPYMYELVNSRTGKFEALNGALWQDGIFIYVPDNVTLADPLHLLRYAAGNGSSRYFRLLVVVGRNADVSLIDEYAGGAQDEKEMALANGAVELFGLEDSRTRYISLQRLGMGTRFYQTHRASIKQNAQMLTIPLAFGGALTKQNFGVRLDGPGAESRMYGLLFGTGHQHFDNHTLQHHASGQTYSDIDLKVVLRDRAMSAYTGLIRIEKSARTCEAYQENRNLLLTPNTKAEAIPELEILNQEVSCSHGATVGPIDPMLIFYLTSRGIPAAEAVRMVVSGFVVKTFAQVPEDLRERLTEFVERRLEDL